MSFSLSHIALALSTFALVACSSQVVTHVDGGGTGGGGSGSSSTSATTGSSSSSSVGTSSSASGGPAACGLGGPCDVEGTQCSYLDAGCPQNLVCSSYCGDDCTEGPKIWQTAGAPAIGTACSPDALACSYTWTDPIPFSAVTTSEDIACEGGAWTFVDSMSCNGGQFCTGPAALGAACDGSCSGCTYTSPQACGQQVLQCDVAQGNSGTWVLAACM